MRSFRDLTIWQRAHGLALAVCRTTQRHAARGARGLPGLISQLRRAAMSVPTHIAEGCGHDGARDYARFLGIAVGSAVELEYLLILARDLGTLDAEQADALIAEAVSVRRLTHRLRALILAPARGRAPEHMVH
jgi:four helix bundle protein